PISLTADESAQKAEILLYMAWRDRHDIEFTLPPEYLALEPADVITITGKWGDHELRLYEVNYLSDGRLHCKAKYESASSYTSFATGDKGQGVEQTIPKLPTPAKFHILDLPLISGDLDTYVFTAMSGGH